MNIESSLKENKIVVFVIPVAKYSDCINEITSSVTEASKNIIYVTLNKPYKVLADSFSKQGIDLGKIHFIDGISGTVKADDNCKVTFVASPKALTELSIEITESMKDGIDAIIFDSVSTLLVYEEASTVVKFMHSLIAKIRESNKNCIITSLLDDADKSLLKDIGMFVDKVVELN